MGRDVEDALPGTDQRIGLGPAGPLPAGRATDAVAGTHGIRAANGAASRMQGPGEPG